MRARPLQSFHLGRRCGRWGEGIGALGSGVWIGNWGFAAVWDAASGGLRNGARSGRVEGAGMLDE